MKGNYLITTDGWFVAPDGKQYKAAWGKVEILEDNALGVKTNKNSSNWYAKVGSQDKHVFIAGCQIHYAVKSDEVPNTDDVWGYPEQSQEKPTRDVRKTKPTESLIYIAQ